MPIIDGTPFDDVIAGTLADDTILGLAGDDQLDGTDGDDRVDGGAGDDTLYGGNGNDTLVDGFGSDLIIADFEADLVVIGLGDPSDVDRVFLGQGDDRLDLSGAGAQQVILDYSFLTVGATVSLNFASPSSTVDKGFWGEDTITSALTSVSNGAFAIQGSSFGDRFEIENARADFGAFTIKPGDGVDSYVLRGFETGVTLDLSMASELVGATQGSVVNLNGPTMQILNDGFGNTETLGGDGALSYFVLTQNSDSFTGSDAREEIEGLGGRDTINGGDGSDLLSFSQGRYHDLVVDLAAGTALGGSLVADGSISLAVDYTLTGITDVRGSAADDTIRGDSGGNFLIGAGGEDVLEGRGGNDTLEGGDGNDTLRGGEGADDLRGDLGNDLVQGQAGDDRLFLSLGNDTLEGGDGSDTLIVEHLVLTTQSSRVTIDLETNSFSMFDLSLGNPVISGLENVLFDMAADAKITGTDGRNELDSHSGDDRLNGLGGDDVFRPGLGKDVIVGGAGFDTLSYQEFFSSQDTGVNVLFQTTNAGHATNWLGQTDEFTSIEGIIGSLLGDTISSADGNDSINGARGDDIILSGEGRDTILGGGGDDLINGEGGIDKLVVANERQNFTMRISPDEITLTDRILFGDGSDTLINMEQIAFGDVTWNLDKFDSGANLSEAELRELTEVYIAYYNRAPDSEGLMFWANALAEGFALQSIAEDFFTQPETQATYANLNDNTAFAQQVYQNVLGRTFDADGLAFWVSALDSGNVSKPAFILEMLKGAKAAPPAGASQDFITQQLIDQEYLALKTEVGIEFAVERGLSNVESARTVMSIYTGSGESVQNAISQSEIYLQNALTETNPEFLIQLVGVIPPDMDMLPPPT